MRSAPTRLPAALLLLSLSTLAGCALPYYMHAAAGQVRLLRQRVPIEEVVADAATDDETRERLVRVTELRRFASTALELPENDSYTTYVDLGRDYVVWNVVAADEFSVEPVTWCFPVAGCVAYRGYFAVERAQAFAEKLEQRGFDTFVGGSPAYSTLGHFDDPVLNTMLARGDTEIAAMLFHELAHQRVYVKDDTELSESFATAVEQYAVERWLTDRGLHDELDDYRARLARQDDFSKLIARQRERLTAIFRRDVEPMTMRRDKTEAYAEMRLEYEALKQEWAGASDYDGWFDGDFNNARLVALTSYQRWVPGLKDQISRLGAAAFYAEIENLAELEPEQRLARLESWNASVVAALPDHRQLVDAAPDISVSNGLHRLGLDPQSAEAVVAADVGDRQ
jgi:predicted aminopeptidase